MKEITGNPYLTQVTVDDESQRIFATKIQLATSADEPLWRNATASEQLVWAEAMQAREQYV